MRSEYKQNLINKIVRKRGDTVYFFDSAGVYQSMPVSDLENSNITNYLFQDDGRVYYLDIRPSEIGYDNGNKMKKAICQMKIGETIEQLEEYLSNVQLKKHPKPTGIDRFVTSVDKPIFVRSNDNPNENTFDYIYVDVNIIPEWHQNKKKYILEHMDEIKEKVVSRIEKDAVFKRYGIPINFLKAARITLSKSKNFLQFVFELKI